MAPAEGSDPQVSATDYTSTYNGLTFGGPSGVIQILKVEGLEDLPAIRVGDSPRGYVDGEFYGRDVLSGRTITYDLQLFAGSQGLTFRQLVNLFKAAFLPLSTGTQVLQFQLPGETLKRINVRCRRRHLPLDTDYTFGYGLGAVEFFAADPRIYEDAASSLSIGLSGASGGLTFPLTFNATFGSTAAPNTQVATNIGTVSTKPVITVTGPVDTPVIQNVTQGSLLKVNVVLASGDTLTIDTDARSVMLNGTASRRSSLSVDSTFWDLSPGANTIKYSAAAATASTATLAWRSAYL